MAGAVFSQDSPDSHQSWLWITIFLTIVYSVMVLGIRAMIKWRLYSADDAALGLGYFVALTGHCCVFVALKNGLGKRGDLLSQDETSLVSRLILATRITLFITLGLSQIATLLFVRRLYNSDSVKAWRLCNICMGIAAFTSILSTIIMAAGCDSQQFLTAQPNAACSNEKSRITVVILIQSLAEIMVIALPLYLLSDIQMQAEQRRLVYSGFLVRLTIFPLLIYWAVSFIKFTQTDQDNIGIIPNMVTQESLAGLSLILATAPCLRSFIKRFHTGGISEISESRKSTQLGSKPGTRTSMTFGSLSIQSAFNSFTKRSEQRNKLAFRPDIENQHFSRIWHSTDGFVANDPDNSHLIHHQLTFAVEYSDAPLQTPGSVMCGQSLGSSSLYFLASAAAPFD